MPTCTSNRCLYRRDDQPESEFEGHKWCRSCRERNAGYKRQKTGYQVSGFSLKKTNLKIGEPPKFAAEWQKIMWENWLRDLIKEVQYE